MKKASGMREEGERSSYLTDNERNDKSIENLNKEYVKDCFIYSAVVHCAKIKAISSASSSTSKEDAEKMKNLFLIPFFLFSLLFIVPF